MATGRRNRKGQFQRTPDPEGVPARDIAYTVIALGVLAFVLLMVALYGTPA